MPRKLLGLVLPVMAFALVCIGVSAQKVAPEQRQNNHEEKAPAHFSTGVSRPLRSFLRADGTLNLPPEPIQGSIDPGGFQMITGPGGEPRFVGAERGPAPEVTGDENWDPGFHMHGMNGRIYALAWDGTNLYAGGYFTTAGTAVAKNIAMWNGTAWSALGSGMDGPVGVLVWDGADLYAGGGFVTAGGVTVNHIAMWNGSAWSALGSGIDGGIVALAWDGANLYAGGNFHTAGGVAVNYIAAWNGSTWSPLGTGVDGTVNALVWDGTHLYAGGEFWTAGGVSAAGIAMWDGSAWSTLGSIFYTVKALAWDGTNLYAGGKFGIAGGVAVNHIAKWDGVRWSPLGAGVDGTVNALAWDGTHLYAGGEFWTAGGVSAAGIAMWDGTGWSALGSGVNHTVKALALGGTNLYAGGEFTTAGGVTANYIARWNGSGWRPMPASGEGISGDLDAYHAVVALAWAGTNLYAGGDFTVAGGVVANHVAKWDGTEWSGLGSGTNGGNANGPVSAVAWDGTNLYAGGYFRTAGGVAANYIAKWDGSEWSALGTGLDDCVNDLTCGGGNLYAGGAFTTAGGVSASYIAKWNGSEWSALGAGLEDGVSAMAWDGANLYVGGWFTSAGGVPANHIAKWDGKEWSALGTGLNGLVYALAWDGTNLYAGGDFTTAGDAAVNHIAQWDGSRWTALGTGVDGLVNALAWNGTNLYVGGQFRTAGGVIANNIAVWDGAVWSALGSGTNGPVWALVCDATNLYVGGNFTTSGAKPSSCIGHWCAPPEAPAAPFFTNVTTTALTINWTAVTGAASYNVWRASGGACVGAVKITESPVSRTSYRDFALTCSTTYSYFITAGNDCGASIDGTCAPVMTAPCCPAITLSPSSLPGGAVGVGYSQTLAASGGTAPYTYTLASGDSPGGLSFSTNGVLSGTPATAGTFAFTVAATDSNQCTGSGAYTVTISGGCAAITLLPSNLPRASVGTAYSQTISASGGTSPYVFKVTSGSLPAGLILDSSGVLAGTPTATGTFGITVTATDDASCEGSRTYSLSVVDPLAVSISSDETSGTTPFSVGFSSDVTGGDGNYEYHWDFGDGTSLAVPNPTKVYDTAGSYNARLTVTDGASQSAVSNTLNMTVFAPMELTLSASPAGGTAPLAVGFATQASGGDGHYTYDYEYGDGTSGSEPYHTYSQAGTYAAKVNASDASGHTATSQAVTIKAYAPLSVTIAASSTSGTAPFSVDFTSNVTGGDGVYTLAWDFGDGGSGSGATATHTYASTGTFHVTAVATDAAGHSATSSALAITVTPVPPVIASAHKQHAPFRIVLLGSNFQPNCTATIKGTPVDVKYKNGGKIKLKHCKALCPKGVAVVIVITNPDGGVSAPFQFTK